MMGSMKLTTKQITVGDLEIVHQISLTGRKCCNDLCFPKMPPGKAMRNCVLLLW